MKLEPLFLPFARSSVIVRNPHSITTSPIMPAANTPHPVLCQPSRRAFTLVELLTVIAIIGILAAIIIPTVGRVRASARQAQCLSNIRQLALASLMFAEDDKQHRLPPIYTDSAEFFGTTTLQHWNQSVASYLGYNPDLYGIDPKINQMGVQICPSFVPAENRATAYGVNIYMVRGQTFSHRWSYKLDIIPSRAGTIMLGEKNYNISQVDARLSPKGPEMRHSGGANWAFCDGHVKYVRDPIPDDDPRWKWW